MSDVHAATPAPKRRSAAPAAWLVLGTMGVASVVFQVDHALGGGLPRWLIAGVVGFAPVAVSLGVAHMIALHRGGTAVRVAAILVMACGMTLSMGAIAWVVGPYYHSWLRWLFGVLLDGAALFAAWVLLGDHARRAAEASAVAEAAVMVQAAEDAARDARSEASELATALQGVRAELDALRVRVPARKPRRSSARKPRSGSGPVPAGSSGSGAGKVPPGTSGPADVPDLDTEAYILKLIDEGHSASEAGVLAGKSDSYGRQVARLAKAAKREPAGSQRTDGDVL